MSFEASFAVLPCPTILPPAMLRKTPIRAGFLAFGFSLFGNVNPTEHKFRGGQDTDQGRLSSLWLLSGWNFLPDQAQMPRKAHYVVLKSNGNNMARLLCTYILCINKFTRACFLLFLFTYRQLPWPRVARKRFYSDLHKSMQTFTVL